jgi:uncharacterized protein YjbI with pentapeptide repeats
VEQQERTPVNRQRWRQAATVALGVFLAIIILGYAFELKWVGVVDFKDTTYRTLWDWLELFIFPAALAIGAAWLNWAQRQREREAQEARRQREREAQVAQREREREAQVAQRERELDVENQRAQDEALQAYLDQMSQRLLDNDRPLRESEEGDEVRTLARARTLTVLARLDGQRKGNVVRFLYEAGLILKDRPIVVLQQSALREADLIVAYLIGADLSGADLRGADLSGADLTEADLSEAYLIKAHLRQAHLSRAEVRGAYLREAYLKWADLSDANLTDANLQEADLSWSNLSGANLTNANLAEADLRWSILSGALLLQTYLKRADLTGADLSGARGMTAGQLEQVAKSLNDATMPNGQKYRRLTQ